MDQNQTDCENKGGTWTEVDGAWKCVHPDRSDDSAAEPATEGTEEAL